MKEEKLSEKKKKNSSAVTGILNSLMVFSFLLFMGIRLISLLPGWGNVVDSYGYYGSAVIENAVPRMTSGIAHAYTENLARLLHLTDSQKWIVAVYHVLLQIAILFLSMGGCYLLFGKKASYFSAAIITFSPWMLRSIYRLSPENYYLFWWAFGFLLVGFYYYKGRRSGWHRNNAGEGYLLFMGFVLGVLCIWHFYSFVLLILLSYAVIRIMPSVQERVRVQKNLMEMAKLADENWEENYDDRREVMAISSQLFVLVSGIFVGGFSTLMKYTGLTGNFIIGQFKWWIHQLRLPGGGRWQDMSLWLPVQMTLIIVAGVVFSLLSHEVIEYQEEEQLPMKEKKERKKQHQKEQITETETVDSFDDWRFDKMESEAESGVESEAESQDDWKFDYDFEIDDWSFDSIPEEKKEEKAEEMTKEMTEETKENADYEKQKAKEEQVEERKIKYLENPLPLPKKHVKKVMDFETVSEKDDFDFDIDVDIKDDFDV